MKLWIARDEDGYLKLFDEKPLKQNKEGIWISKRGFINYLILSPKLFPEVTFDNSPKELNL